MGVQANGGDFAAPVELLERALGAVLEEEGWAASDAELSVTLVDDAEITRLNREYLDRDRPTDVIAFSLGEPHAPIGDIYVCVDQALRQAVEHEVTREEELVRLAVHGALHACGHEHPDGPERVRSPMFEIQERLVAAVMGERR